MWTALIFSSLSFSCNPSALKEVQIHIKLKISISSKLASSTIHLCLEDKFPQNLEGSCLSSSQMCSQNLSSHIQSVYTHVCEGQHELCLSEEHSRKSQSIWFVAQLTLNNLLDDHCFFSCKVGMITDFTSSLLLRSK